MKGSVVDDRNLVGSAQDVIGATRACLVFDRRAGLRNNIPKFLGLANNPADRALAGTTFDGHILKVTSETALVGFGLTNKRAIRPMLSSVGHGPPHCWSQTPGGSQEASGSGCRPACRMLWQHLGLPFHECYRQADHGRHQHHVRAQAWPKVSGTHLHPVC